MTSRLKIVYPLTLNLKALFKEFLLAHTFFFVDEFISLRND